MYNVTNAQQRPSQRSTLTQEKNILFTIGELVTRARCIATLFSLGIGAIVVGSVCMCKARDSRPESWPTNNDPLTTAGLLLLTLGSMFFFAGMSIVIYACCFTDASNEDTAESSRGVHRCTAVAHICLPVETLVTAEPPPPYPGLVKNEEPPPPYPGL